MDLIAHSHYIRICTRTHPQHYRTAPHRTAHRTKSPFHNARAQAYQPNIDGFRAPPLPNSTSRPLNGPALGCTFPSSYPPPPPKIHPASHTPTQKPLQFLLLLLKNRAIPVDSQKSVLVFPFKVQTLRRFPFPSQYASSLAFFIYTSLAHIFAFGIYPLVQGFLFVFLGMILKRSERTIFSFISIPHPNPSSPSSFFRFLGHPILSIRPAWLPHPPSIREHPLTFFTRNPQPAIFLPPLFFYYHL